MEGTVEAPVVETKVKKEKESKTASKALEALKEGSKTQKELATLFGVQSSSVNQALRKLIGAGKIKREKGTGEKSSYLYSLV